MKIIDATARLAERRGVKILIIGPSGVGKTSLLRGLDPASTLLLDIEAGDLSIQDVAVDVARPATWNEARDWACVLGGPNPALPPTACYSEAHFKAACERIDDPVRFNKYRLFFVDSITAASRLSLTWAEQQPEAMSDRTGRKDTRAIYGTHAREMISWLQQLQRARGIHVVLVGILERVTDEFNRSEWQVQIEGAKSARELPGIVDEIVTMQFIKFDEQSDPVRAFVCTSPNPWIYPAKDRSGRLEQIEEPHLGRLIAKLTNRQVSPAAEAATQAKGEVS